MRTALLLAFCCATLPASVPAAEADADGPVGALSSAAGVREAEQARAQALGQRDIHLLRRLLSGDYYHVESNGRVRTKTEFLQALARGEFRLRAYGIEDMEVKVMNNGATAIVTGSYRATMQGRAAAQPVRGRYVRVWTRHLDGWRNALHQSTEIRPAASASLPATRLQ